MSASVENVLVVDDVLTWEFATWVCVHVVGAY